MEYRDNVKAIWKAVDSLRDDFVREIIIESDSSATLATRDGVGLKSRIDQAGFKIAFCRYDFVDGDMNKPFWSTFKIEITPQQS